MAKVTLATGIILAYGYFAEAFTGWYSGSEFEIYMLKNRLVGPYAPCYYLLLTCNVIIPQLLWSAKIRVNTVALWILSLVINVGMWLERFIIIVTSLHRDFVPSSWGMYYPTFWDVTTFLGTISFFLFLIFLFVRFLPAISIFEAKELLREVKGEHH
jgi:molybdopterin-containing oxidoreductase family membrane subunit